jgi:hypothetical protein
LAGRGSGSADQIGSGDFVVIGHPAFERAIVALRMLSPLSGLTKFATMWLATCWQTSGYERPTGYVPGFLPFTLASLLKARL